jgi:hypothetical protein
MIEADYFARKRQELGLDRADVLEEVQRVLDTWYPGRARAKQLHQGVLRVICPSSSVATELRMRQVELLTVAEQAAGTRPSRLAITIQNLS